MILGSLGQVISGDTSSFSVRHNIDSSLAELNNDLAKISYWAHQWKMSFNPDPSKQVQEVISSRTVNKYSHPKFNNINNKIFYHATPQKYLGIIFDNRLSFEEHLGLAFSKISKIIKTSVTQALMHQPQDSHFLLYMKLLSGLILIMVTLYMKKLIIHPFARK